MRAATLLTNQASGISSSMNRIGKGKRKEWGIKKRRRGDSGVERIWNFPFRGHSGSLTREKRKREEQGQQCGPIFIPTSLSGCSFRRPVATLFLFAVDASALNSSAHEWTSTPPSLIKLSGYRASGTQLVFSRRRSWYPAAAFDSYSLKILGSGRNREEIFSPRWNIFLTRPSRDNKHLSITWR